MVPFYPIVEVHGPAPQVADSEEGFVVMLWKARARRWGCCKGIYLGNCGLLWARFVLILVVHLPSGISPFAHPGGSSDRTNFSFVLHFVLVLRMQSGVAEEEDYNSDRTVASLVQYATEKVGKENTMER